jgi:hypothetical protein
MTVDEASRHDIYLKLEAVLGRDAAMTLMEHLPPVGWADVATKRDLDHVADVLESRLLAQFRSELVAQTRAFVLSMYGAVLTSAGIAVGVARAL